MTFGTVEGCDGGFMESLTSSWWWPAWRPQSQPCCWWRWWCWWWGWWWRAARGGGRSWSAKESSPPSMRRRWERDKSLGEDKIFASFETRILSARVDHRPLSVSRCGSAAVITGDSRICRLIEWAITHRPKPHPDPELRVSSSFYRNEVHPKKGKHNLTNTLVWNYRPT